MGDDEGDCNPTRVEVNSWVFLMLSKRGGNGKDAKKHGGNSIENSYKVRVL